MTVNVRPLHRIQSLEVLFFAAAALVILILFIFIIVYSVMPILSACSHMGFGATLR